MNKDKAMEVLNMGPTEIAGALHISRSWWYRLPNRLPEQHVNQVIGLCIRTNKHIPKRYLGDLKARKFLNEMNSLVDNKIVIKEGK
jgi:hypothetical protein